MADRVTQLVAEVMALLTPLYPPTGNGALGWAVGAKAIKGKDSPPRVVWVPTRDVYGPAIKARDVSQRALRTRAAGVDAHCWAQDLESAERLVHQVVAAVHRVAHGAFDVSDGAWVTQEIAQYLTLGEACVVSFTFQLPVVETALATTTTTTVVADVALDPSGAVAGDGILQAGES